MRRKKKSKPARQKPESRSVPIDESVLEALESQKAAFAQKFGRDPGPDDPLFFDPEADDPRPIGDSAQAVEELDRAILQAMVQAGIRPQLIHAWRRTGLLATAENWERLTREQRAAWEAALAEYEELTRRPQ